MEKILGALKMKDLYEMKSGESFGKRNEATGKKENRN